MKMLGNGCKWRNVAAMANTQLRPKPRRFYARSHSPIWDDDRTGHTSRRAAESAAALKPQGFISNRPAPSPEAGQ